MWSGSSKPCNPPSPDYLHHLRMQWSNSTHRSPRHGHLHSHLRVRCPSISFVLKVDATLHIAVTRFRFSLPITRPALEVGFFVARHQMLGCSYSVMRLNFFFMTTQPATPQITSWVSSLSSLRVGGSSDARRLPILRAAINH